MDPDDYCGSVWFTDAVDGPGWRAGHPESKGGGGIFGKASDTDGTLRS